MAIGSWKAPFPLRFGGKTTDVTDSFWRMLRANRPDILRSDSTSTDVEIEAKAAARMLESAWRTTQRRVAQRDPLKLNAAVRPYKDATTGETADASPLERWEKILDVRPPYGASLQSRRAAVKARLVGSSSTTDAAVSTAMGAVFGEWFDGTVTYEADDVHYAGKSPAGTVTAYYGTSGTTFTSSYPGQYSATYPWMSGLCRVVVRFAPPASADELEIRARIRTATDVLDAMLPAWMCGRIARANTDGTYGFILGTSLLGVHSV